MSIALIIICVCAGWLLAFSFLFGMEKGDVTASLVGLAMIQLKVARLLHSHDRDGYVDIAGYSGATYDAVTRDRELEATAS